MCSKKADMALLVEIRRYTLEEECQNCVVCYLGVIENE